MSTYKPLVSGTIPISFDTKGRIINSTAVNLVNSEQRSLFVEVIGSTTLTNSGIYLLNAPTVNSIITLPPPANMISATFIIYNNSSFTYALTTPSGYILWNNVSSSSVLLDNTIGATYTLESNRFNYILTYVNEQVNTTVNYDIDCGSL
jgi:hypothetical protein